MMNQLSLSNLRSLLIGRNAGAHRLLSIQATLTEATGVTGRKHRSNAEKLVAESKVVEVSGKTAICEGGGGNLGHPVEYIQLNKVKVGEPETCKYCGTRYVSKHGHHDHH